jgi:hypothetical protein
MEDKTLKEIVDSLLLIPSITIQEIEKQIVSNGGIIELEGGDENHGTYSIFRKNHKSEIDITKCSCGHIHLLEDMCIKCHPEWLTRPDSDVSAFSYMYRDLPF